jgi:hypothetical protein
MATAPPLALIHPTSGKWGSRKLAGSKLGRSGRGKGLGPGLWVIREWGTLVQQETTWKGEEMTSSVRVVALGAVVAIVMALCSLSVSPQAGASTYNNGSINGIAKEKLLHGICTRGKDRELFRVINPYHHRSKMEIAVQGGEKRFHMRQRSIRRVSTRMVFFPGASGPDAQLYINNRLVDADNVPKKRCR